MTWILSFLAPVWGWLAAAAAAVGALLVALASAKRDGRKDERAKLKETDNAKADTVRDRVADARKRGVQPDDKRGYRD